MIDVHPNWRTRIKKSTWIPVRPGISLVNQPRHAVNVEDESRGAQFWFGLIN